MKNKCSFANHGNRNIITACLAAQCQGNRVCCSKCQVEFHQHHNIDQFADINHLLQFIKTQSQKSCVPQPNVVQALQELNNILKDIDYLTKLIRLEIQRLNSANLQSFCQHIGQRYKIFTQQVNNQQLNDLIQEMLSRVKLQEGDVVEKNSFEIHLGKPYSHFIKQFALTLTKITNEFKLVNSIINTSVIPQRQKIKIQQIDDNIDPNPFLRLTVPLVLQQHTNIITAIDICEQRSLLLSGSLDMTVKITDLKDPKQVLKIYYDTDWVFDVVFSSQGRFMAFGGRSGVIKLADIGDLRKNDVIFELKGHTSYINRLTFSNDQIYLISGGRDNTVRVWTVSMKEELFRFQTDSAVFGLSININNTLIVAHTCSTGIKIWDLNNKRLLCSQIGHSYGLGIVFSEDQEQLVSSGDDCMIKLWSLKQLNQGKLLLIKELKAANSDIQRVLLTMDSKYIISYSKKDKQVKVMSTNTGDLVKWFEIKNNGDPSHVGLAITKKGDMIIYGDGKDVVLWKQG